MIKIAVIVEGPGDILSYPALIARASAEFGLDILAPNPIKANGIGRLLQEGQLERYVAQAMSRDIEAAVIAIDLDDGCAVSVLDRFGERIQALRDRYSRRVEVVFCLREYEAWFLSQVDLLKVSISDYIWTQENQPANPFAIRNAKGCVRDYIGKPYKETVDQLKLTRGLDLKRLYHDSRAFRRFMRAVSGLDYNTLDGLAGIA